MKNFRIRKILHEVTHPNGFRVICYGAGIDVHVGLAWKDEISAIFASVPWNLREDILIVSRRGIFKKHRLGI